MKSIMGTEWFFKKISINHYSSPIIAVSSLPNLPTFFLVESGPTVSSSLRSKYYLEYLWNVTSLHPRSLIQPIHICPFGIYYFSSISVTGFPDAKSQLLWKVPDAGKDWRQKEKRASEDEMVGWHHRCNGHELEPTSRDDKGQGGLACCSPQVRRELDMTGWLSKNLTIFLNRIPMISDWIRQICVLLSLSSLDLSFLTMGNLSLLSSASILSMSLLLFRSKQNCFDIWNLHEYLFTYMFFFNLFKK